MFIETWLLVIISIAVGLIIIWLIVANVDRNNQKKRENELLEALAWFYPPLAEPEAFGVREQDNIYYDDFGGPIYFKGDIIPSRVLSKYEKAKEHMKHKDESKTTRDTYRFLNPTATGA